MQFIKLYKNKNVILIDTSYYVFYRYFATFKWLSFQKIEIEVENITENETFIQAFYKHINSDLKKVCKKWKTDTNNIVFCMDCLRSDIWRNDIYTEYKASRVHTNNFNRGIFPIFYNYFKQLNIQSINCERLEADDVIYLAQSKIKPQIISDIIVITNDNDYLQIVDKNVHVFNIQFKELKTRGTNDPFTDLLFKAIYGDKSDNIPKIASGITKEIALNLAKEIASSIQSSSIKERHDYIEKKTMYDKLLFNLKLISFQNIPDEYVDKFYKNYNFTIV
jgi:5'-3' exonuclease